MRSSTPSNAITILSTYEPPPAPALRTASFRADGSAVHVAFTADTNRAGYTSAFACVQLLDFAGANRARCEWIDASRIAIYPASALSSSTQVLVPGSTVTLLGARNVTAACNDAPALCASYETALSMTVTVEPPAVKARPSAALTLPSALSGCSSMEVDITASTGSGGRAWQTPTFSVTNAGNEAEAIALYLNANFSSNSPTVVPSYLFAQSGTYTLTMTLCNFLGACDTVSKSVSVNKEADAAVVVTIPGQPLREITTGTGLLLTSSAYLVNCQGLRSYSNLSPVWSVYEEGELQSHLRSESLDLSTFRLSPFRLSPLRYYEARLTVSNSLTGAYSSASVIVRVAQAEVVASVQGGSLQAVAIGSAITLDGSSSVDRDKLPTVTGAAAGLSFSWACVQTAPVFGPACPFDLSRNGSVARREGVLFALIRAINTTARVTLTVTDAARTRTSTTSVSIKAQDSAAPVVTMTSNSDALAFVNVMRNVLVSGTVTVQSSCTAKWTSSAHPSGLDRLALTPPSAVIPAGTSQTMNLLLAAGSLPPRSALTFTLSCGVSSAAIVVTTNGPPLPGTFEVAPLNGTELTTPFSFMATLWTDPNLPISYQFGFMSPSTGVSMVVQSRAEVSRATSTLPAGNAGIARFSLTCMVHVFDILNAVSSASAEVTVQTQANATALQETLRAKLTSSVGNNGATKGLLSLSGAVLNTVSCAQAPSCAPLNRAACSRVENTCGECLSGFIGEVGSKNSQCVSVAAAVTAIATSPVASNATCRSNSDCGTWQVCNATLPVPTCNLPSKKCPNQCSGHGSCRFYRISNKAMIPDCKAGDPGCSALCECVESFSGQDCGTSTAVVQQRQTLRTEFLQTLLSVAKTDDVNEENIASLSTSLASLTQNPYELSEGLQGVVGEVAAIVLYGVESLRSVPFETISGVLDAVDAAAEAAARENVNSSVSFLIADTVAQF